MATTTKIETSSIVELYTAYFNRVSDGTGLKYWMERYSFIKESNADTQSGPSFHLAQKISSGALLQVAQEMTSSEEYTAQYSTSTTNESFLSTVYQNILNRGIDSAGLNFWSNHLEKGSFTRSEAIVKIIDGAKSNTTEAGKLDAALLANKTTVSEHFALKLNPDALTNPEVAKDAAKAFASVTSDPSSVQAAINNIDNSTVINNIDNSTSIDNSTTDSSIKIDNSITDKSTKIDKSSVVNNIDSSTKIDNSITDKSVTINNTDSNNTSTTTNTTTNNISNGKALEYYNNDEAFINHNEISNLDLDLDLVGINTFDTGVII